MAKIKVTLPGKEIPANGKRVSFVAPCDSTTEDFLVISGVEYAVLDAYECLPLNAWKAGNIVSVILNCDERKACLQNASYATEDYVQKAIREALGDVSFSAMDAVIGGEAG